MVQMSVKLILAELKDMGTAQNRKIYARHGAAEPMYGVSYANLKTLTKRIKSDHTLALQLWDSGIHDARVLATMIADPVAVKAKEIDDWFKALNSGIVAGAFADFVSRTRFAVKKVLKWTNSNDEWRAVAGWQTLAKLAMADRAHANPTQTIELDDTYFEPFLQLIAEHVHSRQNQVRHAMNGALIAIGCRNSKLEKRALAIAKSIGKVVVDHGETSCKTPDATSYILKTKAHYATKTT